MTICVPIMQKNTMTLQKSQLEFQSMSVSSNAQQVTQSLSMLSSNKDVDMESNQVKHLQYLSQMFTQQQASLDSQLKALNAQLEGLNKLIDANIKSDCKLNLLG